MSFNRLDTKRGVYEWEGDLANSTVVTTPSGQKVTFYSLVSMTNGEALEWFDHYLPRQESKVADSVIGKAGRNAIDVALAKLDDIPMVDDKHISVPWPITERPKLDPEVWEESEIKSVTIADLYASQELLTKERVIFFIENPGAIELGRRTFANVYDLGERLVIVDGHHRLAAMWLLGADAANVWFLEE